MEMERRKAARFKGDIYFSFRTKSIFSRQESPIIMVKDISASGLSFIYPEAQAFGQKLVLKLYLPMYAKPVKVEAEVKKSERLPDGQYKTGLEFIKISPEIQKNLEPRTYLAYRLKAKEE
jgi:c-di-GMP-binding flagellar brake protein YcgR